MQRSDTDSDDFIRRTLDEADAGSPDHDDARSAARLLAEVFRGRNRRLALGGATVNLVLFVLALFSGLRFLGADDARGTAFWGTAMLLAFGLLIAVKIWYWLEMNRLALAREIKRVELRVAHLAESVEDQQASSD